jgi:hypothetical protein
MYTSLYDELFSGIECTSTWSSLSIRTNEIAKLLFWNTIFHQNQLNGWENDTWEQLDDTSLLCLHNMHSAGIRSYFPVYILRFNSSTSRNTWVMKLNVCSVSRKCLSSYVNIPRNHMAQGMLQVLGSEANCSDRALAFAWYNKHVSKAAAQTRFCKMNQLFLVPVSISQPCEMRIYTGGKVGIYRFSARITNMSSAPPTMNSTFLSSKAYVCWLQLCIH